MSEKVFDTRLSRAWKVPRLTFDLSAGRLALEKESFLVPDAQLSCKDLLFGFAVLRHLGIDSGTAGKEPCYSRRHRMLRHSTPQDLNASQELWAVDRSQTPAT